MIQNQIKDAMRAKDALRLETLRYVLSQIKYAAIEKRADLSEEETQNVLSKEVKKRKDAIDLFRHSGRLELVSEEEQKLAVITGLLPEQLPTAEVEKIVREVLAKSTDRNMGVIMKTVLQEVAGRSDGKTVSAIVRSLLSE